MFSLPRAGRAEPEPRIKVRGKLRGGPGCLRSKPGVGVAGSERARFRLWSNADTGRTLPSKTEPYADDPTRLGLAAESALPAKGRDRVEPP